MQNFQFSSENSLQQKQNTASFDGEYITQVLRIFSPLCNVRKKKDLNSLLSPFSFVLCPGMQLLGIHSQYFAQPFILFVQAFLGYHHLIKLSRLHPNVF